MPIGTNDTASIWNIMKPKITRQPQSNKNQNSNFWLKLLEFVGIEILAAALAEITGGLSEVVANSFELSAGTVETISIIAELTTDFTVHEINDAVHNDVTGFNTFLNAFSSLGGLNKFNINKLKRLTKIDKLSPQEFKVLGKIKKQITTDKTLFNLFKNNMTFYALLKLYDESLKHKNQNPNLTLFNNLLNNNPTTLSNSYSSLNNKLNSSSPIFIKNIIFNKVNNPQPLWKTALYYQILNKWNIKNKLLWRQNHNKPLSTKVTKCNSLLKVHGLKPWTTKDSYYQVVTINQIYGCLIIYQNNNFNILIDNYPNLNSILTTSLKNLIPKTQFNNFNKNINQRWWTKIKPIIDSNQKIINQYSNQNNIKIYQPQILLKKGIN